ncbi:tetratricopeptide repeat protein [Pelagibacterium montanilacus]|uniref:tetratricopeptide repeat protein n=1 Tax=Pelagibacterium montanilacus TaxID=2185280 RepID=UPI000F8DF2BD|nr:tetratricopeptide repeat protein [Pelagibacterium montanilacus]
MTAHIWHLAIAMFLGISLAAGPAPAHAQTVEDGRSAAQQGEPDRAISIWTGLAEAGDAEAQFWLAESNWGGWWGVPQNLELVAHWHTRAAEQNHVPSFVKLGHMHADGVHFAQSDDAAATWFRRAGEAGDANGQYALGHLYYRGSGVPHDYGEALRLWQRAHAQGHEGARLDLCAEIADFCEH